VAAEFSFTPLGPFDLSKQKAYFGEWISPADDPSAVILPFPVEGWQGSCAVMFSQPAPGKLRGQVFGPYHLGNEAKAQAVAALSLDVNGAQWPDVGLRDPVIGRLQQQYSFLRPVLFHSPYEAAAAFIIGHRISIKQRRVIVSRMSQEMGEKIDVNGRSFSAFPLPGKLSSLRQFPGLNEMKIGRLRAISRAAASGLLDRARLRSTAVEDALTRLMELPGIGPFFAQGILHRGAGLVDSITDDETSRYAIQTAYRLGRLPDKETMLRIAEPWQPFRMWALVLLHVWLRREVGLPSRSAFRR